MKDKKDKWKEIKKLISKKLTNVRREHNGDELVLEFEDKELKISAQDSSSYGSGIFFEIEDLKNVTKRWRW